MKNKFAFIDKNDVVPNFDDDNKEWRQFIPENFTKVHWTFNLSSGRNYYRNENEKSRSRLICNGFLIPNGFKLLDKTYNWQLPRVSIFDFNSRLPISLTYIIE